jgi:hypothetical protein
MFSGFGSVLAMRPRQDASSPRRLAYRVDYVQRAQPAIPHKPSVGFTPYLHRNIRTDTIIGQLFIVII